ncbi:DctP family TRAP transporter solute-binding subunit [Planococcus beigongshangi]|uniref:DctP family TRAP transporter solute-binding subunit n=1 Tax=Planococcus beigongshangi TaxID=2782536 RepID=UPI00193B03DE|nr:DctP family TRAP transporter solute-binding subunit [Planococcus beigongshangi]
MRKLLMLLTSLIVFFVVGCSNEGAGSGGTSNNSQESNSSETIEFRIGTGNNESHPHYHGMVKLKEVLEEEGGDRFDVKFFLNSTVGDDREMIEGLQMGTLDATIPAVGVVSNFVTDFEIFNFPFLFPNEEVADEVLGGPTGQQILDRLQEQGQGVLGMDYWEQGFFLLTNSSREVKTLEDLKGLSIRTIENEIQVDTLRALGANPTPMPWGELFTAMQQGVVDGQQNPIANIHSAKFYEVQDYLTITNHHYGPSIFLVSEIFWNKLSEEEQQLVDKAIKAGNTEAKRVMREQNAAQLQEVEEYGMTITELDDSEIDRMRELAQPVIEKYSEEIGKDFVNEFYQAVEDAQK